MCGEDLLQVAPWGCSSRYKQTPFHPSIAKRRLAVPQSLSNGKAAVQDARYAPLPGFDSVSSFRSGCDMHQDQRLGVDVRILGCLPSVQATDRALGSQPRLLRRFWQLLALHAHDVDIVPTLFALLLDRLDLNECRTNNGE